MQEKIDWITEKLNNEDFKTLLEVIKSEVIATKPINRITLNIKK